MEALRADYGVYKKKSTRFCKFYYVSLKIIRGGYMKFNQALDEDTMEEGTIHVKGGWENKGKHHKGKAHKFPSKKKADNQRKAMFAHGYHP